MTLDELADRLSGVRRTGRGLTARCPAHDDRRNSLTVAAGDDGRLLLHCFASCRPEAIVRAVGLELRDLFADTRQPIQRRSTRSASALDEARRAVLQEARRQMARLAPYREAFRDADAIKLLHRTVAEARRAVTAAGPDRCDAWDLARAAADLERDAFLAELEA